MPTAEPAAKKPRIVILGGGFGGAYAAKTLGRKMRRGEAEVLVIDRHNYFVFFPLLVEAGTGALAPNHAVVSIRSFLGKQSEFLMASVVGVDTARQIVRVRVDEEDADREIPYDHLLVALGSVTKFPPIPGLKDHAFEVKSIVQAIGLRDRAVSLLERANSSGDEAYCRRLLNWVVVGGSYTGVEVAGEFHEYMREMARRYPKLQPEWVTVTVVDHNPMVLKSLDEKLGKWAGEHMERRGIRLAMNDGVASVTDDAVTLTSGKVIPCSTVIWAAGIAPNPFVKNCGLPLNQGGWIECESDGRVKGMTNVWAVGDIAANPAPDGKAFPATAQHGLREGRLAARNILRSLRSQPTKPMKIKDLGVLASFGRFDAVASVMGIRVAGVLAWFMWRSIYLMKMPGWSRSFRIALDWTADLLFDRDYVAFGTSRIVAAAKLEAHREANPSSVPQTAGISEGSRSPLPPNSGEPSISQAAEATTVVA